jgi:hypothetical protein
MKHCTHAHINVKRARIRGSVEGTAGQAVSRGTRPVATGMDLGVMESTESFSAKI